MGETGKAYLARAMRIMLAFTLVFWGSFSIESLAFAQVSNPLIGQIDDHADDELSDFAVFEVAPTPSEDNKTGLGARLSKASDTDETKMTVAFSAPGESREFVAIPAWNGEDFSISNKAVEIANFVKWDVTCNPEGCANVTASKDNAGLITLTGSAAGEATITCELSDEAKEGLVIDEALGQDAKATFGVSVSKPAPEVSKRVSELRILDEEGHLLTGSTEGALVLPKNAVGTPYAFQVEIKVSVIEGDSETSETYDTLADAREAGIAISWTLASGEDVANITQDGVLTLEKEGAAIVHVEASIGSETAPAEISVKTEGTVDPKHDDDPEPDPITPVEQGASNPQAALTVVSNARTPTGKDDGDSSSEGNTADASPSDTEDSSGGSAPKSPTPSSSSSAPASDSPDKPEAGSTVEKEYTASDLEELGTARATYTMYGADGKFVTVTGEGPYLIALLRDIGIENTEQIESLTFVSADGNSTTVNWADLESANRYYPHAYEGDLRDSESSSPLVAIRSLVRGLNDGTGEGLDSGAAGKDADSTEEPAKPSSESASKTKGKSGESSSPSSSSAKSSASSPATEGLSTDVDLVDNTRFRILFGSTSPARTVIDPDALRWVNKIVVNVKPAEEKPEFDTDIAVSVEYVPVPLGAPAVFMALPNTEIKNARFDFTWEVSTNGGKTWKAVENGNVQGLRVVTTEKRIGNQYRVVMETNANDKNGLENVTVTSKPVTMIEGNGLAVVLEYDPPIAGQTAFFQTTLYGAKSGVPVEYTWEQSQDGGLTWTPIRGRTGSSLAVPTEPIDPNASSEEDGSGEVVPITYIHVIAKETAGEKREAVSEAVPLTVHVDDEKTDDDPSKKPSESDPTPDPSEDEDPKPDSKQPPVVPISDITIEYGDNVPPATPTAPTDNGTATQQVNPSKLYINESVTDKVNDQQQRVDEYIESTQPGARWTSLSPSRTTDDDVRNILADNPFAPFVFPLGLGITVAGGLEKFLAFRKQTS